jgi:hypothetical protein
MVNDADGERRLPDRREAGIMTMMPALAWGDVNAAATKD